MIKVTVMYANAPGARFDYEYYRNRHMPLVKGPMADIPNYTDQSPQVQISEVIVDGP